MVLVFKRILILTHNINFAIDTKRSLEQIGDYNVTTVSDAVSALETLRHQAHHLVLLDVESLNFPPPNMISGIRKIQPEIAIVLAPDLPDVHDIARMSNVQGVVNIPGPARSLMPVLDNAIHEVYDTLPDTAQAPKFDLNQETRLIETLVDDLLDLDIDDTPYFTSRQIRAQKHPLDPIEGLEGTTHPHSSLEIRIDKTDEGETVSFVQADFPGDDRSLALFQKLAQEEPPMPLLGESGTVGDLARSIVQSSFEQIRGGLDMIGEDEETDKSDEDEVDLINIPAVLILQTAGDETTPVEAMSLQTLYSNIKDRLPEDKQSIRPLPSWLKESEKFVREPFFLDDNILTFDTYTSIEYTSTTTEPSQSADVLPNPEELETEVFDLPFEHGTASHEELIQAIDQINHPEDIDESIEETVAQTEDQLAIDEPYDEYSDYLEEVDEETDYEEEPEFIEEADELDADSSDSLPVSQVSSGEESFITQLAVTLTQVSTELTAEATILTRDNNIIAYSGDMPMEDIEDLRSVIGGDWSAGADQSRIRFLTLSASGKDYMLYSIRTVGNLTLSMAFAGTKQLRVIRKQGQRLLDALSAVPDLEESVPVEDEETPDVPIVAIETPAEMVAPSASSADKPSDEAIEVLAKAPFSFIWLLDSTDIELSEKVAQALVFWLDVQLNSLYWTVNALTVDADFIYLFADVPGDVSPADLIRELMMRSAKIARSEDDNLPEKLWADAYLVLKPGRKMEDNEIQRFINFARM